MKRKYYLIFALIFMPLSYADPFYGEAEQAETASPKAENIPEISKNPTDCQLGNSSNLPNFELEKTKLKLVGILKNGEQFKALYVTENQQLIDLKSEDLVGTHQIKSINLKSVEWIDWQKTENCQQPFIFIEKL